MMPPYLLAIATAAAGWVIYPRVDLWPFVFVLVAPLLVAIEGQGAGKRFVLGWIAGTVLTPGSHYFIAETLVNLGGLPWAAAVPVFLLYSAWSGIQLGLFALGASVLRRFGGHWLWLVTVPVWFALLERWHPVWFQAYISNVLWHVPVLTQSLEIVGPSGLTALVVFVSCALVHALEAVRASRPRPWLVPAAALALWVVLGIWGAYRMQTFASAPADRTIRVALVQPYVSVAEKRNPPVALRRKIWDRTIALSRGALEPKPDLLVWPEGALPFQYERDAWTKPFSGRESLRTRLSRRLHELAANLDLPFVAGGLRTEDGRVRNSAVFFRPGREGSQTYDKRKLVLLAEKVPFGDSFPGLVESLPGASHHAEGDRYEHFDVAGSRWVPSMCYEAVFPTITREALAEAGGGVLLNLTNDVWFGDTSEPSVHLMMQVPRTVENRVWLVRSTNSGITAIVDPTGTIVARTDQEKPDVLRFEVPIQPFGPTFYHRFGDLLIVLVGGMGFAATGWNAYRAPRPPRSDLPPVAG